LLRSPIKPDLDLTASPRSLVFAPSWTVAAILAATLGCWLLLFWGATHMDSPAARLTMPMFDWSLANWLAVFIMWAVMMAAMMLPSAAPMVLCFGELNRRRGETIRTLLFVAAYLALWIAFSGAATVSQWALQAIGWISPMIVSRSSVLSVGLLLIAGVFQFSRIKLACLRACRSPLGFLMSDWRDGLWGAWRMGMRHGLYCLTCCWALMALLFVGGAMNLLWIAALTCLVAIEKLAPKGEWVARMLGVAMIGAGAAKWIWASLA
jgi:predicted metal-binding membrane protein